MVKVDEIFLGERLKVAVAFDEQLKELAGIISMHCLKLRRMAAAKR